MKTYYDGEEREILKIVQHSDRVRGDPYWNVYYKRGESYGNLIVQAKDELDAMRKFPEALARMSINPEDDNNVS
jgi:hypothetical protein